MAINVDRNADKGTDYYRVALEFQPDAPRNMPFLARLGGILLSAQGDPEMQRLGLTIYEDILKRFDYMDYYERDQVFGTESPQYLMITVAMRVGDAAPGDQEHARAFYLKGLQMLDKTYKKRLEEWKRDPPPQKPVDELGGPKEISKWESRVALWKERHAQVDSGEILQKDEGLEEVVTKALVSKYIGTYGQRRPGDTQRILDPIILAFPGSPIEKEARRAITTAK